MNDGTFSIIGTSGRQDDKKRLTDKHFLAMLECSKLMLEQFQSSSYEVNTLVSGGAAWADHVAVKLFLDKQIPHLRLYLPCPFLSDKKIFDITPRSDYEKRTNLSCGEILNGYHNLFSQKCRFTSLNEIQLAIENGAEIIIGNGFKHRNAKVAESDAILAITFGENEFVKDGGTAHTISCYLNRVKRLGFFDKSFHYDLNSGEIFSGARIKPIVEPDM